MEGGFVVDYLTREALNQCVRHNITIQRPLLCYIITWLHASREKDLFFADKENRVKIHNWMYKQVIENGPVIRILRLTYYFSHATTEYHAVQTKYENITKAKLISLLEAICACSSTTKKEQESLFRKIVVYIIASKKLFSVKNAQMLSEAKCALHSIVTMNDLIDFTSRKKHYRLDFLARVGNIMCGILLYNKHADVGGEGIRDVVNDVNLAYKNTLESWREKCRHCNELIKIGLKAIANIPKINLNNNTVTYKIPKGFTLDDIYHFNKFNYLHLQYEIDLLRLSEPLHRLKYRIENDIAQMKEVLFELDEVIKFKMPVPTELVYPHFMELFKTWYKILMKLYYLVELNKIMDDMEEIVHTDYPFEATAAKFCTPEEVRDEEVDISHLTMKPEDGEEEEEGCFMGLERRQSSSLFRNPLQRFCGLTMAITGGLLVAGDTVFGLAPYLNNYITFKRKYYAEFTEKHYGNVIKQLHTIAFENPEMCVLFKIPLDSSPSTKLKAPKPTTVKSSKNKPIEAALQTEHCVPPATIESRNTYSWNIWYYRRMAIRLAQLKRCLTHSVQTNLTYSSKDANVQTYYKTSSTHRGICDSSQLSKSVCHILGEKGKLPPSDCHNAESQPIKGLCDKKI